MVQVSINITDARASPVHAVLERVRAEAAQRGIEVVRHGDVRHGTRRGAPRRLRALPRLAGFDAERQVIEPAASRPRGGRLRWGSVLFRHARICTPRDQGTVLAGAAQGSVLAWEKGALLCRDGKIVTIGDEAAILGAIGSARGSGIEAEIDCEGRCMIPGFVDPHTHLCFLQPREREFQARLRGADDMDILRGRGRDPLDRRLRARRLRGGAVRGHEGTRPCRAGPGHDNGGDQDRGTVLRGKPSRSSSA